ncbi:4-hydroxy-2-oxoheptanedioate aldolase [Deinococcus sp. MIMF12]|uniref:4-hydroxy-2-oxoheptanedioate aldolase n=1 Tax=Deinococcus rhizophilus TaxID=3049544 RepID=A0ABT7JHG9_9DEIO|nr:4-hydroxy-2-oxoheptanedioate aldolase [Deinococcus rhizophilus]MDL2344505.1 4-hydroxy-2-oxoheptanedioate aldolase [Deinococcus rhizophilus]
MAADNSFKAALGRGDTLYGLWLSLADAYSAEVCAGAGFDWLVVDGEHAPNDLRSILAQLQALAAYPSAPVVRLPVGDPVLVKQVLDIGARTLLIPMVESAVQAREMVAATRYPPQGVRGVASALVRASRFSRDANYLQHANDGICLLVQVESVKGLEALDALAAVEGVDGVFIGPADLAASLGHLGNPGHPDVQAAIRDAASRIRDAGKAAGILATDEETARRYLGWGYTFVAVGVDVLLLTRASTQLLGRFRG